VRVVSLQHPDREIHQALAVLDAIGLGAFAVVGTDKALRLELHWLAAIFVGVVNAVGGDCCATY